MRTTARREGGGWVLNGEKTWITNGSSADVAVVWARADEGDSRLPGGARHARVCDLRYSRQMVDAGLGDFQPVVCRIAACRSANRLPGARGLKAPLTCLTQARYGIGWGVLGAAMDCYETARQYAMLRKQFDGRPIASHQLVQEKLAWMITEITKAQLLAVQAGRLKDQGKADRRAHFHAEAQ